MSKPDFTKKQKKLGASILAVIVAVVLALANGKDIKQVFTNLLETGLDEKGTGTGDSGSLFSDDASGTPDNPAENPTKGPTKPEQPTNTPTKAANTPAPTNAPTKAANTPTPTGTPTKAANTPTPTSTPTKAANTPTPTNAPTNTPAPELSKAPEELVEEDGVYSTPELVAAYLYVFHKLPSNYITKNDAVKLGWDSEKGNLWDVTEQMSIGGSRFGNYEGLLPDAKGRTWYECDVNYNGGYRGAERILYSNDGLIYYTGDHYKTFTRLY